MQSNSGKRKDSKGTRRPWKRASTCLIALIFLTNCSHFNNSIKSTPQEILASLCLSGTGKGRIEHRKNKFLFDYKALHQQKNKNWTIGIDLPLVGQEILSFDYRKNIATGPFAYRLRKQDRKGKMKEVYKLLGQLLKMVDKGVLESGWHLKARSQGGVTLTNAQDFSGHFFAKKNGKYRRTVLTFEKSKRNLFRLQLFSNSCSI